MEHLSAVKDIKNMKNNVKKYQLVSDVVKEIVHVSLQFFTFTMNYHFVVFNLMVSYQQQSNLTFFFLNQILNKRRSKLVKIENTALEHYPDKGMYLIAFFSLNSVTRHGI